MGSADQLGRACIQEAHFPWRCWRLPTSPFPPHGSPLGIGRRSAARWPGCWPGAHVRHPTPPGRKLRWRAAARRARGRCHGGRGGRSLRCPSVGARLLTRPRQSRGSSRWHWRSERQRGLRRRCQWRRALPGRTWTRRPALRCVLGRRRRGLPQLRGGRPW